MEALIGSWITPIEMIEEQDWRPLGFEAVRWIVLSARLKITPHSQKTELGGAIGIQKDCASALASLALTVEVEFFHGFPPCHSRVREASNQRRCLLQCNHRI